MKEQIAQLEPAAETWTTEHVLHWAFETFADKVAISTALGSGGMVMIDVASRVCRKFRVFTLDTKFLFPETYDLIDRVQQRYGVTIEKMDSPLSPEEQERLHGPALWLRNPDRCCDLRKIDPLRRKLSGLQAWITSIRRDQTAGRASARKIEWDDKFGLVKVNPLADWTSRQLWQYIREHDVPYNPLHDLNYPSIGCTHCTRAVLPGEPERAGRWSGLAKTECGLHIIQQLAGPPEADASAELRGAAGSTTTVS